VTVPVVLLPLAALLGLAVGSFLTVVVQRVPRGGSVVRPPSACPRCGHPIRGRDRVPVLSWLLLRGRCRDCAEPIARRYPLVEAGTGAAFVVVTATVGATWVLPAMLYLTAVAVALALIDLDVHRLPDAIVLPSYPVLAVLLTLASWNPGGASDWGALLRAGAGGAGLLACYLAAASAHPAGMGLGDVKLAGVLGMVLAWCGWGALAVGASAAFLLAALFSAALMGAGRAGRRSGIAFGPWMLLGALAGLAVGQPVADRYVGLLG
jgi:leader peptidase (prepilin peptidase)/N-methyltransferase